MTKSPLAGRMITGVLWLAGARAVGQAVAWLSTVVVVRLLAPADYGLMGMAVLVTSFLMLFNELGLGAAIVQKRELTDEQLVDLRAVIVGINIALFGGVLIAAPAVARYFAEPGLTNILRTLGLGFVIGGIGAPSSFMLQRQMEFKKKATAELVGNLCGSVSTLTLAWTGWGVWSLVYGYLIQQSIINALYCVHSPIAHALTFNRRNVAPFVNFGLKVAVARVLWYISSNADFVVVGRVLGTLQLGLYTLAFQFSSLPIEKIVTIVGQVAFPSFATLQHDRPTLRRYYLKLLGIVALVTFPMFIGLCLSADIAVPLFFTNKWLPVVVPLQLLSLVSCLRAIETMNGPALLALGSSRLVLVNNLLQAVVMSIGFYIGAQYGVTGVSISWCITWPLLYSVVTWQTLRQLELTVGEYVGAIRHALAGSFAMAASVMLVRAAVPGSVPPLALFLLVATVGGGTYAAYIAVFNRDAVRSLRQVLRRTPPSTVDAPATTAVTLPGQASMSSLAKVE